ncbi:MAG: hypothetical protein CMD35_00435 [Flavobacteriales bacterium]|nr:hypothetical protein [Flavobacteriales bacterium]
MNRTTKRSFVLTVLILGNLSGITQNMDAMVDNSAESWSIAELRYYPSKKFRFGIEQQLRFNDNISTFDRTFTELNGRFSFLKNFNFGLTYRYMFINDHTGNTQGFEKHFRWDYYISQKIKVSQFEIQNRIKYQNRKEIRDPSIRCICETRNYWRLKSGVKYKIKNWKYDPYFSSEIFLPTNKREKQLNNRYRLAIGTDIKISKRQKLRVRYMFEREIKSWNPEANSIFQIKYMYAIKKKKKKE